VPSRRRAAAWPTRPPRFLVSATRVRTKMARAVEFAAVLGADKVDQALRLAATAGRFDEAIQTDNGAEFQSSFHYHVLDKGIAHTYIKPASPHLNGKVERSHRIDGGVLPAPRGHGRRRHRRLRRQTPRMGGLLQLPPPPRQTPYERLKQKTRPKCKCTSSAAT